MLLAKGGGENTLCTQCDASHPVCGNVIGGGHCIVRYPDWMWILQMLLDADADPDKPAVKLTSQERTLVHTHMKNVGNWGFNFSNWYSSPCNCSTVNCSETIDCFPTTSCNEARMQWCQAPTQAVEYATHGVSGNAMPLKEGAVRWRATRDPAAWDLSYLKVSLLDRYHGQPVYLPCISLHLPDISL